MDATSPDASNVETPTLDSSWEKVVEGFEVIPSDIDAESAPAFDPWHGKKYPRQEPVDTSHVWDNWSGQATGYWSTTSEPKASSDTLCESCGAQIHGHHVSEQCGGCKRTFHKQRLKTHGCNHCWNWETWSSHGWSIPSKTPESDAPPSWWGRSVHGERKTWDD